MNDECTPEENLQSGNRYSLIVPVRKKDPCIYIYHPVQEVSCMKLQYFFLAVCLLLALAVLPASAFTAKNLDITIRQNGDADISFEYELSWAESLAYTFIPQKEQIIRSALDSRFPSMKVSNIHVERGRTGLFVKDFAGTSTSKAKPKTTTYTTPAISFMLAGDLLDNYEWIARYIEPDFSPDVTVVEFPDGQQYTYYDVSGIQPISYTITSG